MAGSRARIKVDFLVNDRQLNAGFMRAWKKADTFGKRMDLIAGRMQSFGATMTAGVTVPIVAGLTLATKAAIDEQKEMALLDQALRKNVDATDAQVASVEKWVTKTQNWSGIADGELRPALAAIVRSTKDTSKAQELLGIAMDISVAKGKPLQTVSEAIAKAYAGNTTALGRLGIRMKDAEGKTLDFEQVMDRAKDTFGGAAAKAADTTAGKLAILKAKLADTAEEVGTALIPMVETAAGVISDLAEGFNNLSPGMKKAATYAALVAAAIGPTSWLAGSGIKLVRRLAEMYKAVAKWAGLAAAAEKGVGGKGLVAGKGAATAAGGAASAAGGAAGFATTFAAVAAPIIAGAIAGQLVYSNRNQGRSEYAKTLADRGFSAARMNDPGARAAAMAKNAEDAAARAEAAMQRLYAGAAKASGKAFPAFLKALDAMKTGMLDLSLDTEKPLESLQSMQARLMELGMSAEDAFKVLKAQFGKDVVAPFKKTLLGVPPVMDSVSSKVKARHTEMANKLLQKIRMPAPDASALLNTLQQVYNKLVNLGYSADQAAQAIARAVSAAGHLKSGVGAGGHAFASGGIASGPSTGYTATLHGTEMIIPISSRASAGDFAIAGAGSAGNITVQVVVPGGTTLIGTAREVGEVIAPHVARALGRTAARAGRRH